ncbi:bacteriocin immunity protein [Enterococcus malodoratus]|uniref:bacteriocin immunity protein n=1 Tax=Enterococcus malodoratus TaxID=71451 RepID=UPI003FD35C3B
MKAAETDPRKQAQQLIHDLYNRLIKRQNPPETVTDITDVLLQVYRKLDNEKNPAALVNRLVNYIYRVGFDNKVHFDKAEEQLIIDLGTISNRAGFNGVYRSDAGSKAQFYSVFDR